MLYVDTETFSTVNIKTAGTFKYTENCELILAYFKNPETGQEFIFDIEDDTTFPSWLLEHIQEGAPIAAWNAMFDYLVLKQHGLPVVLTQMYDCMAKAQAAGLPGKLEKCGIALGLEEDSRKMAAGTRLVTKFCTPHKESKVKPYDRIYGHMDPEAWTEFRDEYLRRDVESMILIDSMLPDLSEDEHEVWVETQAINIDGVPIDLEMAVHINNKLESFIDELSSKFIRLTKCFPTQRTAVMNWCLSNRVQLPNLQAQTVKDVIEHPDCPPIVKEALSTRADITHMSYKKYPAFIATTCKDGTVKGTLNYHSATTGRFGGRLIQTQNLTRGNIPADEAVAKIKAGEFSVELVKSAVRGMIYHPDGLTIADWGQIEARMLLWLARDDDGLDVFRNNLDPYKWMAQRIYGVPYEAVTDGQRWVGKQAVLGLGYSMGAKEFLSQTSDYGGEMTPEEAIIVVDKYRNTHPKVVSLWNSINNAAKMAIQNPGKRIRTARGIYFYKDPTSIFLECQLISGRSIYYPYPELDGQFTITYMGVNAQNQWVRERTYGGKLVENLCQALCRDILVHAVRSIREANIRVVTHVHDEIVVLGDKVSELEAIMTIAPHWCEDLPLTVNAHYVERFKKL